MKKLWLLMLAALLAGCARGVEPPPPAAPVELNGSTFRLVAYRGTPLSGDGKYLLTFDAKALQANFCNRMFGNYRIADGTITAVLAATKMYCSAPQLMELEQTFSQMLAAGCVLQQESHILRLVDERGVAVFEYAVYMD